MFNKLCAFLNNESGEAYVGEAIKIVIAVVVGVALLMGTLVIFKDTIMPHVTMFAKKMFLNVQAVQGGYTSANAMGKDLFALCIRYGVELPVDWDTYDEASKDPAFWDFFYYWVNGE